MNLTLRIPDTLKSFSHMDLYLNIYNENPLIKHIVRQKRRFHLFNCQNFSIPAATSHRNYIFQIIRYCMACVLYLYFFNRGLLLRRKLLTQEICFVRIVIIFSHLFCLVPDIYWTLTVTLRVLQVEQKLLICPEQQSTPRI